MILIRKILVARVAAAAALAASIILAAPIFTSTGGARLATAAALASVRQPPVNFRLRKLDGSWITLSEFRGRPVIVDFWATWCGPCRRQIPELMALYKRYHKATGLMVIGVSVDSVQGAGVQGARDFATELGINYPVVMATQKVMDKFGIYALPTTFFIGRDGRIVSHLTGTGDPGDLKSHLMTLLGGKPPRHRDSGPESNPVINL